MEAATPSSPVINLEQEKKEILNRYRSLLRASRRKFDEDDKKLIRKAFNVAVEAHKDARRKSGEPYIYHPIAVARIAAEEIGLGATAIACALLHDVVEDTDITLKDIEGMFGKKVASIIDGLTKISGVFDASSSLQAENFRKMLLTLADDVRVILIKLADRLHNMRTLESMERTKQLKIASETLYLYAPLAHRLGLNNIKTELEDLGLKYTEPEIYNDIDQKLKDTQAERARYIHRFIVPLRDVLHEQSLKFRIFGRPKSVYSIWHKMKTKNVPFEEVYDIFAIRVIIDSPPEREKADCWRVYSIVTDFYYPNPDRLRDWVSTPKANGYEALHTTVMGPNGQWVEVQVRSERMNEVAEKGYAAHWKYKQGQGHVEDPLEEWLRKIRESLSNPDSNALDFIDDFKLNLFADEIFVFTPKGEMRSMPVNSTALDFAFDVHSEIGAKCIGAKVNHKLVPLSHKLNSGDQVELLTSNKQTPKLDWMNFVVTAKAKSRIKEFLKEEKTKQIDTGREELKKKMHHLKLEFNDTSVKRLAAFLKLPDTNELLYRVALGNITNKELKEFVKVKDQKIEPHVPAQTLEQLVSNKRGKSDFLVIGDNLDNLEYKLSPCCSPIPGDDVFGFITIHEGIKIHRVNCPNAIELMSNYAYRIVKAKWTSQKLISFLAGIKVIGIDKLGLVNGVTQIISNELNVNMRYISFDTNDGTFEGNIMVFVHDTAHLTSLMKKLEKVDGVIKVTRVDTNQ
ncbi:MAG TPA: bifunctional (p)ppGpp synthetase/guanosine-3',5'-bis(diphosphate) 3'-pyrophosphohydrolase [Bacteroidia bacterium]|nr:bifunctional (p)ppGpp synthetase/guanosine-3',5'-bis(diphosphate) 3'-pyrophosphohydrolase [Bacteroidia bacterium]